MVDDRNGHDDLPQLPAVPAPAIGATARVAARAVKADFNDDSPQPLIRLPSAKPDLPPPAEPPPAPSHQTDSSEQSDVLRGRTFGGYELLLKIGQGGMGMVYKASQISLDRVVAIKILSKALSENSEFIKRFEREAKSIGRISHANIVAVYDFGRVEGVFYMVTEFIEGSNLAKMINEQIMLPAEQLVPLMIHCLSGMHHVAQQGIVHRDIKPDNILVTKDGIAKIADFGLAKDVTNDTDLTATGLAMGTPAYMSPEQCMGRKLDVRSDLYSLGITAYFGLTGEKPFTGQSSFEIMTKQREYMPPPPLQLNPRLPKDLSNLVMRMMAKNPHDRFKDADECRQAWLSLGQANGLLPITTSGEYHFSSAEMAKLKATGEAQAAAAAALPSALHAPPSLAPVVPMVPVTSSIAPPPLPIGEAPSANQPGSERRSVPTDRENRISLRSGGEAVTCPKCGFLNRLGAKRCQRCDAPLVAEAEADQHGQAQRLFDQGQFAQAAQLFGRLADKTDDRRLRTVLRSREREARIKEQENQTTELLSRSKHLCERGDYKGALEILERGMGGMRESTTSSGDIEGRLVAEVEAIRRRLQGKRNAVHGVIIAVMLVLLAVAGWFIWQKFQQTTAESPAPQADPSAPVETTP